MTLRRARHRSRVRRGSDPSAALGLKQKYEDEKLARKQQYDQEKLPVRNGTRPIRRLCRRRSSTRI